MQELFKDILSVEGVKGLMLFSFAGEPVYKEFNQEPPEGIEGRDWSVFTESLAGMRETDLIFKKGRLYIRRTDIGYLVVLMGLSCADCHDAASMRHITAISKAGQINQRDQTSF
jgi:hypothetical protein